MTGSTIFWRPVSPTEWFYLAGARLAPPFAVQALVEGQGRIGCEELTHAVAAASAACPGARLVRRGRTWLDSGRTPPVRRLELPGGGPVRLDGPVLGPALRRPLNPESGPTCEVLLLDHGGATPSALVFRAFHGVMDGRGLLAWVTDVFRVLRGEEPIGAASRMTDHGLAGELGNVGRRPRLGADWRPSLEGSGRPTGPGAAVFRRRSVDGTHPGLVAKIAAVLATAAGHDRSRFLVPVDLRRHRPGLVSTANLTLPILLDARPGEAWEGLHERLLRAMADRREVTTGGVLERVTGRIPQAGLGTLLAAVTGAADRRRRYLGSAIISDLGRFDLADFSAGSFEAAAVYPLPTHSPLLPVSFAVAETAGRTEITVSCPDDPGAVEKAEDLLDRITEALSPPESRAWSGNDTDRPVPAATVTRLFRAQVQRSPDELALTGPDGDVSYAELDRHSDVVAAELAARGVGKGTVVGLLADRSAEALAGLWGILKAGAGYLPLDPHHPDSRTNWELDDSRAPLCLVQRPYASRITGCRTLVLDDLARSGAPPAPPEAVEPGDLAYVIYTSGSTGRPKGVQVEHRSLVNYVTWASELYRVDADTRFALFTSLAFDLTGTAVFLPLLAGGSVALVPDDVSPVTLRAMIERSGANALKLTPAHLDLIGRLDLAPDGFRVLVVGGEQLRGPVAAQAARLFGPECRIVNEYGPTEATIGCVAHVFDPDRDGVAPAVPIGTPVANMKSFLLDADRRFVPADGVGELYLAGAQLARGYLGRPDLDRERFVRLADGTRAYRTGDLARILPSGVLEYLGRSDDQVKIRGHRVEPGEVAAALEEHPRVARALVTGRVGGQGQTILCGYVVTDRAGQRPDVEVLRAHLAERLPSYMVPTAIVCVPELPRTVNGKVDVHALPDPFAGQDDPVGEPAEPAVRDDVEEAVAKIWAEILRTDAARIGPDADFHRLGGDSVLFLAMLASVATTVVGSEGQEAFMVGLREMIRTPTLGRVCRTARRARHEGREGPVSAL